MKIRKKKEKSKLALDLRLTRIEEKGKINFLSPFSTVSSSSSYFHEFARAISGPHSIFPQDRTFQPVKKWS